MIVKYMMVFILFTGYNDDKVVTNTVMEINNLNQCQYVFNTLKGQSKGLINPIVIGGCFEK